MQEAFKSEKKIAPCALLILHLRDVALRVRLAHAGAGADPSPLPPFALGIALPDCGQPCGRRLVVLSSGLRFVGVLFGRR